MYKKKLGLALGAGGAKGIAHIGFLEVLKENNIPIHCIAGSSMGGLVGGAYSAGCPLEHIKDLAHSIKMLNIVDLDLVLHKNHGFIKGEKVIKLLRPLVENMEIENTKIPFACTAVDVLSGKPVVLNSGNLLQALRATMSIPVIFQPVKIDGMLLIDGGVFNRVPIDVARDMGADVVVAVDVQGEAKAKEDVGSFMQYIVRLFELVDWQISKNKTHTADLYLMPEQDEVDVLSTKQVNNSYLAGKKLGEENIEAIKKLLE